MILRILVLTPAIYSEIKTPEHKREYRIFGTTGPYGTIAEWTKHAEEGGYDRIEYRTLEGELKTIKIEVD